MRQMVTHQTARHEEFQAEGEQDIVGSLVRLTEGRTCSTDQ